MSTDYRAKRIFLTFLTLLIAAAVFSIAVSAAEPEEMLTIEQAIEQAQNQAMAVNAGVDLPADAGLPAAATADVKCKNCKAGTSTDSVSGATSSEGLTTAAYSTSLHGGYVAAGTGMRNRGWGTIIIKNLPSGASTNAAFLYWSVIGPAGVTTPPASYSQGKFNGNAITGTLLGSGPSPCWGGGNIFAYRATVTGLVTGNSVYHLTDFASANKWGDDPWSVSTTFPAAEGASLVYIYSKANYPLTFVKILNGVQTVNMTSGTSTTTFTGLPAYSLPVARTTFIVADGQHNDIAGKSLNFNGRALPSSMLNGTDRQNGVNFLNGNLQDTTSALVKVNPSATSAFARIIPSGDCLVWIAQVVSVSDGNLDTDGDALKDSWETYGYDYDNNGVIDINLQNMGASPYHKDAYIWVDWMQNTTSEINNRHRPNSSVFSTASATFSGANWASATSTLNVDGTPGVKLHSYYGYAVPHQANLPINAPAYDWASVDAIKALHFAPMYRDIFHYCLFAHGYGGSSSSGISRGIPAGDFIVSLGLWGADDTDYAKTGTYIHEFGHNMGLTHGGTDHKNYKPNYLSIMNYFFQIDGLYRNGHWNNYDYQRTTPYTLDENALNEANGIGSVSNGYRTKWYCPGGSTRTSTAAYPIDWDCDGSTDASLVSVDINHDGSKTVLTSQLNWKNLAYNGGDIGGISAGLKNQKVTVADMPKELTHQQYTEMKKTE